MLEYLDGCYYYNNLTLESLTDLGRKMLLLVFYLDLLTMMTIYQSKIPSLMNICLQFQLIPLGTQMLLTICTLERFQHICQREKREKIYNIVPGTAG